VRSPCSRAGDGELSKAELRQAVRGSLGLKASNAEIDRLFDDFDADGGGSEKLRPPATILLRHTHARAPLLPPICALYTFSDSLACVLCSSSLRARSPVLVTALDLKELRPCLKALKEAAAAAANEAEVLRRLAASGRHRGAQLTEAAAAMAEVEAEEARLREDSAHGPISVRLMAALSKSAGTLRLEDVGTRFKGVNASGAISRKAFVKNLLEMDIENATAEEAEAWFDERVQAEQPADAATADATSQSINLLATLKAARQASVEAKESEAVLSKTLVALRRTARSQQVAIRKEASAAAHEAKERELAVQAAKAEQVKAEAEAAEAKRLAKLEKAKAKAAEAKAFQEKVQERRSEAKERQSHAMGQAGGLWGDLTA
jgi:hypothetical protein